MLGFDIDTMLNEETDLQDIDLSEGADLDEHIGDPENDKLIMEQIIVDALLEEAWDKLIEGSLEDLEEDTELLEASGLITESGGRNIVRLNKKAKFEAARKLAIFAIAREKGDRLYKKLSNLWKMERIIEKKLDQKYGSRAIRRVKDNRKKAKAKARGGVNRALSRRRKK